MIVAGEVSGDAHATELIENLRELAPEIEFEFFGLTGERMRQTGVETVVRADDLAIMGLLEIGRALPKFWRVFQTLKRAAIERRPDAVILTDFPDFNLPFAKALKKRGLKIIYYVSPQLWAWRAHRVRNIRRDVDLLLTILPFEQKWYAARNVHHVRYVGHPLVGAVESGLTRREFCGKHNLDSSQPIIALLPGSRGKEITRILPAMLEAATILQRQNPAVQFVIAQAATRSLEEIEAVISHSKFRISNFKILQNETREALAASDAAAVASGTATLETALLNVPQVICYRVSELNWRLLRPLIRVPHFGLINLIAEKRLAPELIQHDLTGANLARELEKLLDSNFNQVKRDELRETIDELGDGGASQMAAQQVLQFLTEQTKAKSLA